MNTTHCFEPIYSPDSRVLILGTMPSPASRQNGFYYSHPRNRFWTVMAALFECPAPCSPQEKKQFLLERRIALWDVLRACDINGAADASIKNAAPNDLHRIFSAADIRAVFTTGSKASSLYARFFADVDIAHIALPSTSPANCAFSAERLIGEYSKILEYLKD